LTDNERTVLHVFASDNESYMMHCIGSQRHQALNQLNNTSQEITINADNQLTKHVLKGTHTHGRLA